MHALNIDALRQPEVVFWTTWARVELLGCGALKQQAPQHGQIKSMRCAITFRKQGVARKLRTQIVDEVRRRAYTEPGLETGGMAEVESARRSYRSFGFVACVPFADHVNDPLRVLMRRLP